MLLISYLSAIVVATSSVPPISESEVGEPVKFLASSEMEGRLTLSKGATRASEYIAKAFKSAGLLPGEKNSYYHLFPVSISQRPTPKCSLSFVLPGNRKLNLKIDQDYRPLVNSFGKTVEASMVYAGYGIERENWNDFENLDVKGKVVVMLRGYPEGQSQISAGSKARNAVDRGAVGVIFAGPIQPGRSELPAYARAQGLAPDLEVPGVGITSAMFKQVTGIDFETARKTTTPGGKTLEGKVKVTAEMISNKGMARNVIGILPGHDPKLKNEIIVIGAHYDHLGYGEVSSMTGSDLVHPGADDNASGTAGVVALAKYFAKRKDNQRTFIFQTYQGEELGLLGSEAWVKDHPEVLKNVSCMVNLDMIGRLREGNLEVFGASSAKEWPSLFKLVDQTNLNLKLSPSVQMDSDHGSFIRRNIPVVFFFTGMHSQYHTEKDTIATLNIPGMARVANCAAQLIHFADALSKKMTFESSSFGPQSSQTGARQGRPVRIGFMPDMTAQGQGVVLMGASQNSPAEKAGFKAGDRIIEFNGVKISDLQTLQEQMMKLKPGDKVKVVYERNGEKKEAEIEAAEGRGPDGPPPSGN